MQGGLVKVNVNILSIDSESLPRPPLFETLLTIGEYIPFEITSNNKKYDLMFATYFDKIDKFHYDQKNKKLIADMPFNWELDFIKKIPYVHAEYYIPKSMEDSVLGKVIEDVNSFKMGATNDPSNFINAVISETSFDKISEFIDYAKKANNAEIIVGGSYDKSKGYFIQPTVIKTTDPKFKTMCEEIFGPVVTVFIYEDENFESILETVNETSEYALTGAVYSQDRYALELAMKKLENSAGNFYINDKPTGAVVGQQPFGGARASGTNDKAGSELNLLRWVSVRTIKETLKTPKDYRYPFLDEV